MTTSDPRERFLELESQASQLVESLDQLRKEANGYKHSSEQLDQVTERISSILDALTTAAQGITQTAAGLNDIGTPEILAAQQSLESAVTQLGHKLDGIESKLELISKQTSRPLLLRLLTFK